MRILYNMGEKDNNDGKVTIHLCSQLLLKSLYLLSSFIVLKSMMMLRLKTQMPKLLTWPKSSVRCGAKLTKPQGTGWKSNIKEQIRGSKGQTRIWGQVWEDREEKKENYQRWQEKEIMIGCNPYLCFLIFGFQQLSTLITH